MCLGIFINEKNKMSVVLFKMNLVSCLTQNTAEKSLGNKIRG